MKSILAILVLTVAALWGAGAALSGAPGAEKGFPIYDNMSYRGKPDTAKDGLIAATILYEDKIWPNKQQLGASPNRETFQALVKAEASNPGPLVIDIESMSLRASPESARHNMETLAKLADWAHEAVPGKVIGYYGTNTLSNVPAVNRTVARELADHVDAFFTPIYTFDDSRASWERRAQAAQAEAHELDPKKPVYFFLWPQYHVGSGKALRYVAAEYWKFQLETARHYSNGIVLWGPSQYVWDDKTGWWAATKQFAASLHAEKK